MTSNMRVVFPADDSVARFVVSMSAARNAVEPAIRRAVVANEADHPEFHSHVLAMTGYLVDGVTALRAYRETRPEVRTFIDRLPPEVRKKLSRAISVEQRVGKGVLAHSRNNTFHFPHPDPGYSPDSDERLKAVLERLADEPARIVAIEEEGRPPQARLHFADQVMLALALDEHDSSESELTRQLKTTQEAAVAFIQFIDAAVKQYLEDRGARVTDRP